jgi:hypothetical protein
VFPYYSDPWVDRDFTKRAEAMDWLNIVQQGASLEEESADNELGSYQWQLRGSLTPSIPALAPYVSNLSISNFTSTMAFRTIEPSLSGVPTNDPRCFAPNTKFFAPDRFTIYNLSGSIAGTPLTVGAEGINRSTARPAPSAEPSEDPLGKIGVPRSPWEKTETGPQNREEADKLRPPVLGQRFDLPWNGGPRFSIDYRISPSSSSELQFRSSPENWPSYNDIDWSEVSSVLSAFGGDAGTNFNLNHSDGLYSNVFSFSGNGSWRQYGYINEEAEPYTTVTMPGTLPVADPKKVSEARKQQYGQSFFSTSYGYTGTLRPLYRDGVWGQSNLQYIVKGLAVRSKFIDTSTGDDPEWEIEYGEWIKEKLDIHQVSTNLSASIMDKTQSFTFTADLPPRETALAGNAAFRVWISETNASMRVRYPEDEDKPKLEPFTATETLRFGTAGSLSQYVVLDTELVELTTLTTSLNLWGLRAEYTASRMAGYNLVLSGSRPGWVPLTGDESLKPRDFTLSYNGNFTKKELWNKRLGFTVNYDSRLFFDLQRFTNSSFRQTLGLTFGINGFLDLSFSATSENTMIYRYLQDIPFFDLPFPYRGEKDLLTDLANSFRFDDEDLRRSSGFKLRNFRLSTVHRLGDWNATLGLTMSPYLDQTTFPYQYKLNSDVSFLVQWVPVSEIKTDIKYDQKTDKWVIE